MFYILFYTLFIALLASHLLYRRSGRRREICHATPFHVHNKKDEGFMKSYWRAVNIIKLVENKISSTFISALRRKGDIMYHAYCIYIVCPSDSLSFPFLCGRELSAMVVHLYGDADGSWFYGKKERK